MSVYQHLVEIARNMEFPLLLISYDRAMSNLPAFLPEIAKFAGVGNFDMNAAIAGIREDGERYFEAPGKGREDAAAGEDVPPKKQSRLKAERRAKAAEAKAKADRRAAQSQSKSPKDFIFL
jgi:hypothetical protein